jgi:aminopeptidase
MTDLISPFDLGSKIKERADYLANHAIINVDELLKALAKPQPYSEAIQNIHLLQRLYLVHATGVAGHPKILEALNDETNFPTWKNFVALKATEHQKDRLATLMASGDPEWRAPILVTLSDYSRDVSEKTVKLLHDRKDEMDIWIADPYLQRRILSIANEEQVTAFANIMGNNHIGMERSIGFRANNTHRPALDPASSQNGFKQFSDIVSELKKEDKNRFYTITVLPTEKDAELDQISYPEYVDLFFRMCDVDWEKIDAAHKILIAKLNAGSMLRITNDDGTDVSMDIKGFTFANSRVAKNVPGSEVFSAPRKDSVNGKIVAKGRFIPKAAGELIENITLDIKDGKIIHYEAEVGQDILASLIETDEGSHFFGEIGIGTNPVLQQHITNSLMVEKIGGSFHMAAGAAYEYTDYLGDPVALDNGNRSKLHWDITTMLVNKGGIM